MSGNLPMALEPDPITDDWSRQAALAIIELAHEKFVFDADDLRDRIPEAPHPSLVGNAFKVARTHGIIKPVGYGMSRSKSRKNGVIRKWTRRIQKEEKK